MYTTPFHYLRPKSLQEAEQLFRDGADAKYLAGGQTLIPTMKARLASPSALIDLGRIPNFAAIKSDGNTLTIGAGACHAQVGASPEIQRTIPALAALALLIGDPAVRHKGTLGGSVANNDPAADYPAAVLALNAVVKTTRRSIPAEEFFTGMFSTALDDGEIITDISFAIPKRAGYSKFRNPASRYAMVGVFVADFGTSVRVAVTGAAPAVFRHTEMESAMARNFTPDAVAGIAWPAEGLNSDIHGSAEFRAHLIGVMAKRAVASAILPA